MSAKWHRSRKWDDEHIPPGLWPVKAVLRAFSSISLAVVLLSLVIVYVTLASVPIGMLAQLPTWAVYCAIALGLFTVLGVAPAAGAARMLRGRGRGVRFVSMLVALIAGGLASAWVWRWYVWPAVHYDPATGRGLMFFADFCSRYRSTTLRRLPGMEMTELQFYAWWPLRVILLAFVLNMVVATVRRIEFTFRNLGVLTVHTGIVVITLGSMYYGSLKQEGDTLLRSGQPGTSGVPGIGPHQDRFYDSTDLSLYVGQQLGFEERPLEGVPRYNDYNLVAFEGDSAQQAGLREQPWLTPEDPAGASRPLDLAVPETTDNLVDRDISFRVVGFASYAEEVQDWRRVDAAGVRGPLNPLRVVFLHSGLPDENGEVSDRPAFSFLLLPGRPAQRLSVMQGALAVEYTIGMGAQRWGDLTTELSPGVRHAVSVELADDPASRTVIEIDPANLPVRAAAGPYELEVQQILAEPPFPIITEGYRDSTSSLAVVRVTKPSDPAFKPFTRYVYHRFPEINQDMLDELNERGMPKRTDPDASIRLGYIDASMIQVYFDDAVAGDGKAGKTRAVVRSGRGPVRVIDPLNAGDSFEFVDKVSLRVGPAWDHAEPVGRPRPVPEMEQDRSLVGTHAQSLLAVEVSSSAVKDASGKPWKTVLWLPFTKYMGVGMGTERDVFLPDGRMVRLAFGRRQHPFPGFRVQLVDFQMIAYDHRGAPRDYQSILRVEPFGGRSFETFEHVTKLNSPLMAPFHWSEDRSYVANLGGRLLSGLDPYQYKFSQAGWDQTGWAQTQQQADAGLIPRPYASFTILGVGNNPGIHVIALGSVMMGVGIPWAFYVKPYLVRREKRAIQAALAARTRREPDAAPAVVTAAASARTSEPAGAQS
ncbi:MAG: hypothetical protein AMXMBFR58_28840 [Phycisphaerae bacterium]